MTCFRELSFQKGKLFQMPIRELAQLREAEHFWQGKRIMRRMSKLNAWKWTSFRRVSCI